MGLMKFLISQNVDGLHLRSGIKPEKIAEFHGNGDLMVCDECGKKFEKKTFWDTRKWGAGYRKRPKVKGQPDCPECGGRIYSTVVNFGDNIPTAELNDSYEHSQKSDVFLVVGSSVLVTPAADMPGYAKKYGKAKIIIINKQETGADHLADIRFYEGAGDTLKAIPEG